MINFNKIWIDIECPNCNYLDQIQLIDVKTEKEFFCNNCKCKILLKDHEGSVHNGIESMNSAMKELAETFKKLGK